MSRYRRILFVISITRTFKMYIMNEIANPCNLNFFGFFKFLKVRWAPLHDDFFQFFAAYSVLNVGFVKFSHNQGENTIFWQYNGSHNST